VLTVNNTHRYRTKGDLRVHAWSTSQAGYLSLQAMSFLFAAQCVARGLSASETVWLGALLEANQRACFEESRRELAVDVAGLRARLGLPPVEVWPPEETFELAELREDALFEPEDERAVWRAEFARFNERRRVFRIAQTRTVGFGAIVAIVLGGAGSAVASHFDWSVTAYAVGRAMLGWLAGAWAGRRTVTYSCSEARCTSALPAETTEKCPKCGGTIGGTLDDAEDRLEAEDALDAGRPMADFRRELAARHRKNARSCSSRSGFSAPSPRRSPSSNRSRTRRAWTRSCGTFPS
jgi:hypothetical protein